MIREAGNGNGTNGGARSYAEFNARLRERGVPMTAVMEITYLCNLRCTFCYNPTHEAIGEMPTKNVIYCLDELAKIGVPKIVLTGGECMAHRDFFQILGEMQKRQFVVEVFTNATLIDKPAAERLKEFPIYQVSTSIHGDNAATHDDATYVPGSFDKLLEALEHLRGAPFPTELKCTVTKRCQEQLHGMKAIADRFGVRIKFSFDIQPRDNGDASPLEECVDQEFMKRYYSEAYDDIRSGGIEKPHEQAEGAPVCGTGLQQMVIDPYGNVFPCVAWRQYAGNIIKDGGIEKVWYGENPVLEEVRGIAQRIPKEVFTEEELGFNHFCPGLARRVFGNPMQVFETERMAIPLRRERYLKELEALEKDPTRQSRFSEYEAD